MPVALLGPAGRLILDRPLYTLGSAPDNQIVLTDLKASPRHASLQLQGQSYSLTDLSSIDGTYLNEQRLFPNSPAFLKNADKIRIGNTIYTYEESLVSSPSYPSYDPTVVANRTPSYDPTVLASQPPPQSSFTGYGQGTPSSPGYPPVAPPPNPSYGGQSSPGYPPVAPPPNPSYGGQSSPGYPPVAPPPNPSYGGQSSPGYPPVEQPQAYGQSSPGYPSYNQPADPYAPANPGFAPIEGQMQQPWGGALPQGFQTQPPQKKGGGLKIAIILIVILLILGGGGGIAGYILTRPKPVITLTSTYTVGTTPAGATDTSFHVGGTDFSGNSAVSFLLDGAPLPGGQTAESDKTGAISATLTITSDWAVGNHTLTAKDASGYQTKVGQALTIVAQGTDKTPGPNGSPTNSAGGTVVTNDLTQNGPFTMTVTGGSDSGGKVCRTVDDGQSHTSSGTSDGSAFTETASATCAGTYQAGKLTYTETITSDKVIFDNGETCVAQVPYVFVQLSGTFTSATAVNGSYSEPLVSFTCSLDGQSETISDPATSGSWSGTAAMG